MQWARDSGLWRIGGGLGENREIARCITAADDWAPQCIAHCSSSKEDCRTGARGELTSPWPSLLSRSSMRASMSSSSSSSSTGCLAAGTWWASFSSNFPLSMFVDSAGAPAVECSAIGAVGAADKLCTGALQGVDGWVWALRTGRSRN